MWVRTSAAAAVAIPLLIWLLGPASIGADEIEAAVGEALEARSEPSGPFEAGLAVESGRCRRVLASPLRVVYSTEPGSGRRQGSGRALDPKDLRRFQRYYREAVEKQLGGTHPVTTEPCSDALQIDTILLDPIVDRSAWNAPARNVYSELQTIRLIVVLRDSPTGVVLRRVELPMRLGTSRWSEQNAVTYWSQVRLVFSQLATRVLWAIEGGSRPTSF